MTDRSNPEYQYLDLLEKVLNDGDYRMDRTGVGTRAIFGTSLRFDLSDGTVPLLTTKKVLWRAAAVELLWFLTGSTSIRPLLEQDVHIWTDWPLAKYRKETGMEIDRKAFETRILEDDAFSEKWSGTGKIYGHQWRSWRNYDGGEPIDQVANTIQMLKVDKYSRRNLFHAWNVAELNDMSLNPCHVLYQFVISNDKATGREKLNVILYQRSADTILGLPFNIFSASILLRMIAQQTDFIPGELQWFGGDTHLYENHIEAAKAQLSRIPGTFPKLEILRKPENIDDYVLEDFSIVGYEPQGFIKAPVAV